MKTWKERRKLYFEGSNLLSKFPIVMEEMTKEFNQKNISFCFIGGAIVYEYGYRRMTEDLDILVSSKDKDSFYELEGIYFKLKFPGAKRKFIWNKYNIPFDVIFTDDSTNFGKYDEPEKYLVFDKGIPKLSLEKLILLKLKVGIADNKDKQLRGNKDLLDVQQLIYFNSLSKDFMKNEKLNNEEVLTFNKLWDNAQILKNKEGEIR